MDDCRACVECLRGVGLVRTHHDSEGPYLEELVLRDARDFYTREACAPAQCCREYVQRVGAALDSCKATFLSSTTVPLLEAVVVERLVEPSIRHVVAGGAGALVDAALGGDASAVSILKRLGDLCRRGGASCDLQRAVATHAAKLAHQTLTSSDERVGLEVLKLLDALTAVVAAAFAPHKVWAIRRTPGTPSTKRGGTYQHL